MTLKLRHDSSGYLTCEHVSVFYLLMLTSGIMGAYTYVVHSTSSIFSFLCSYFDI